MGRSKFPGKPSRLASKKRVSVLVTETSPNPVPSSSSSSPSRDTVSPIGSGADKLCPPQIVVGYNEDTAISSSNSDSRNVCSEAAVCSISNSNANHSVIKVLSPCIKECKNIDQAAADACDDGEIVIVSSNSGGDDKAQDANQTSEQGSDASKDETPSVSSASEEGLKEVPAESSTTTAKKTRKKTVTFKSVLETSDDIVVKKVYNPTGTPLVPIIKKDSIIRSMESIVKPSRLTEIVKQSSFNNLNRIKTLTFNTTDDRDEDDEEEEGSKSLAVSAEGESAEDNPDDETSQGNVSVGDKRFILPKRSLHSRRVIKPNKKFLDDMDGCSAKALKRVNSGNKVKSVLKAESAESNVIGSTSSVKSIKSEKKEEKKGKDLATKEVSSLFGQPVSSVGGELNLTPFGSNKVILRQPRLQFAMPVCTQATTPTNNLFGFSSGATTLDSCGSTSGLSQPVAVSLKGNSLKATASPMVCAICSSKISFNFFEKSSRKFGVNSCELCRKFISKMVKRYGMATENSTTSFSTLQCSKSDGKCLLDPVTLQKQGGLAEEGNAKLLKVAFKQRCHACWLRSCLRIYHLSSNVRTRLWEALPRSMREVQGQSLLSVLATPIMGSVSSGSPNPLSPFSIKREETENQNQIPNLFSGSFAAITTTSTHDQEDIKPESSAKDGKLSSTPVLTKPPLTENNFTTDRGNTSPAEVADRETIVETPVNGPIQIPSVNALVTKSSSCVSPLISNAENKSVASVGVGNDLQIVEKATRGRPKKVSPVEQVTSPKDISHLNDTNSSVERPTTVTSAPLSAVNATLVSATAVNTGPAAENAKRQKIDLKGPRVKHVCRSASIVLGQPLATFPPDSLDTPPRPDSPSNVNMVDPQNRHNCSTCITEEEQHNLGLSPPATPTNVADSETMDTDSVVPDTGLEVAIKVQALATTKEDASTGKGTRKATKSLGLHSTAPPIPNRSHTSGDLTGPNLQPPINQIPMISIDFWENYDPVEISQTGFGLIVTEQVPLRSLCFLCGSLGSSESLMYCVCCCEPYHQYCIEDEYNVKPSLDETLNMSVMPQNQQDGATAHLNWLCPRCTVCSTCNMSNGNKLKCQKCQKNYHSTCLGTSKRLLGADRPLICATCLKCKSCGTCNVTKFVGNLPMCTACFKLRQRGNFCPLCQKCYEENDFDLKMMECGSCEKWVHARCEGLTDEQYYMLSLLPENIEFFCRRCTRKNGNLSDMWREAVAAEFKAGLLSVVKLLSKSRQACALLRLSPRKKANLCICQPINSSRAIHFTKAVENGQLRTEELKDDHRCYCQANQKAVVSNTSPSLLDIKRKIMDNEYTSLQDFNYDVLRIINAVACEDLLTAYKEFVSETFSWFQNETKACTDALVEDMYGSTTDDMDCSVQDERVAALSHQEQTVPNILELPDEADEYFYGKFEAKDSRCCLFCKKSGEGLDVNEYDEGRLLYSGQNTWVHTNCALWSAEVFEEIDGSLQNIHSAVSRGRMIKCSDCGSKGATVGCNLKTCGEHYHYPCAKRVNCAFMADKTVYCPRHLTESVKKKCQMERDFDVLRPVYVELDRRKKKPINVNKIQFVNGSLVVKKLGHLVPTYSDQEGVIVPVDFYCSRLYWSMKEPWKVVEYTIRTTIQSAASLKCRAREPNRMKHFVVDHSLNTGIVQFGLAQINRWHSTLNEEEEQQQQSQISRSGAESVNAYESITAQPTTDADEPQNNADLLPPEIKEVIFDDLPHDILDGISMLDIFPKLMNYEDLMAMDSTTKEVFFNNSELSKDSRDNCSDDDGSSQMSVDSFAPSTSMLHVEDAMLSAARPLSSMARELKRSKSEIFGRGGHGARKIVGQRNQQQQQQRSSSFTWSSKLDPLSAKRRKVSMLQELGLSESVIRSLGSRTDLKAATAINKSITWNTKKLFQLATGEGPSDQKECVLERFKISQLDGMEDLSSDEGGTPDTEYEGGMKPVIVYDISKSVFSAMETPVLCDRCHCAYRTNESYQRHLATCEPMSSTSESESEANSRSPEVNHNMVTLTVTEMNGGNAMPVLTPQGMVSSFNGQIINASNYNGLTGNVMPIQTAAGQVQAIPINGLTQLNGPMQNLIMGTAQPQQQPFMQPMSGSNGFQQSTIFPIQNIADLASANFIQQKGQPLQMATTNTINFANGSGGQGQQQIISVQNGQNVMAIPQISNYTTTTTTTVKSNNSIMHSTSTSQQGTTTAGGQKKLVRLGSSPSVQRQGKVKQTLVPKSAHGNQLKRVMAKSADGTRPIQMLSSNYSMIKPNHQVPQQQQLIHGTPNVTQTNSSMQGLTQNIIFQQQPQALAAQAAQPIIVQQMPNGLFQYVSATPSMDSNQSAAANGMQYILPAANPSPMNYQNTGSYQLQQDVSGNLILANTGGIQMLPGGMTIATQQPNQVQPQVLGTIIQPQAATTIQCGMMAEQMMMGGTQTLEMVQDPTSGCMYLTSQPMFYGLETIVQNTVMSSQQFVSTAMQGVLSQNSICQATTTQVFQASKIEPIMEVPGGYVVLNNVQDLQQQPQQSQAPKVNTSQATHTLIPVSSSTNMAASHMFANQPPTSTSGGTTMSNMNYQSQQEHTQLIQRHLQSQQQQNLIQSHHHQQQQATIVAPQQPQQIRAISPSAAVKPTVKTSPIVITKIQPVVVSSGASNMLTNIVPIVAKSHQQVILPKPDAITVTVTSSPQIIGHSTVTNQGGNIVMATAHPMIISPMQRTSTGMSSSTTNATMVRPTTGIVGKSVKPRVIGKPVAALKMQQQQPRGLANDAAVIVTSSAAYNVQHVENSVTIQPIIEQSKQNLRNSERPHHVYHQYGPKAKILNQQQQHPKQLLQDTFMSSNGTGVVSNSTKSMESVKATMRYTSASQMTTQHASQYAQASVTPVTTSNSYSPGISMTYQFQQPSQIQLPNAPYAQTSQLTIPTNVVNPIQQSQHHHHSGYSATNPSRPMNRVLPMQTIPSRPSPPTPPESKNNTEHENSPIRREVEVIALETEQCNEAIGTLNAMQTERNAEEMVNPLEDDEQGFAMDGGEVSEVITADGQLLSPNSHVSANSTLVIDMPEVGSPSSDDFSDAGHQIDVKLASAEELFDNLKNAGSGTVATSNSGLVNEEQLTDAENGELMKQKISDILVSLDKDVDMEKETLSVSALPEDETEKILAHVIKKRHDVKIRTTFEKENAGIVAAGKEAKMSRMANALQTLSVSNNQLDDQSAGPKLYFEIESQDGFKYRSTSISEVWTKVFEGVQQSRKAYGLTSLPEGPLNEMAGHQMLGLKTNPVRYLLEQLPGMEFFKKYIPKYHQVGSSGRDGAAHLYQAGGNSVIGYGMDQYEELTESAHGAARCAPYAGRSEYDMFSWLASRHRKQPAPVMVQNDSDLIIPRRGSSSNLPMAMRYRTLKETSKQCVGVFRSHIHGRGLYCIRDIEAGEMVIEYAGELIRATLTDKREKHYESKGIGCYMFRIDDNFVVDATMRGNAARFINHSCDPNCFSKVVDILGHKHIIIFALRRIVPGEELTYDYKFPFEEDKIPCSCGARRCRKYLN